MFGTDGVSRSRERRERMRRTVVRKSVLASGALKELLQCSPQPEKAETSLNTEAESFMPMDIEGDSFDFKLVPEDLLDVAPVFKSRQVEVTSAAELLPEPPAADPVCFLVV